MCYYTASRLRFCEIKLQACDDDVMLSNVWFNVAFGAPAVKGLVCAPLPTYCARCAPPHVSRALRRADSRRIMYCTPAEGPACIPMPRTTMLLLLQLLLLDVSYRWMSIANIML